MLGINFALLSGTSMAAPHIAGIAALIKQYNPTWTPAMIASAITTTATKRDNYGDLIMAEAADRSLHIGTYFDFGAGHVSASRAIDPGLVLPIGNLRSPFSNRATKWVLKNVLFSSSENIPDFPQNPNII